MDKIKVYNAILEEDTLGLYTISLVDNPATQTDWLVFSDDKKHIENEHLMFSVLDDGMERKVMVVIMRADFPILREKDGELIYVVFPKETLKLAAQRFMRLGYQNSINIQHQENTYVDGVYMEQLFIKDVNKGITPNGFEDIEDGSLFAVYKIENDEVWDAIRKGVLTSVSLEGLFKMVPVDEKNENDTIDTIDDYDSMIEWLKKQINNNI